MDLQTFLWSVIASILASSIVGGYMVYKKISKDRVKGIKQEGNSNTGIIKSKHIYIGSDRKNDAEKK
jgi:hypothetical protein